eukprot:5826274-Pyramimonas_sp.AAC.1
MKLLEIDVFPTLIAPADLRTKVHSRQRLEWPRRRAGTEAPQRSNNDERDGGEAEVASSMIQRILSSAS